MAVQRIVVAVVLVACLAAPVRGLSLNITSILAGYPEYKQYNKYLTETKVRDEINARDAVTCLVLGDGAMSTLVSDAGAELGAIKNALRLLNLLDYFDPKKMRALDGGATTTDSLYQAAGGATGDLGSVTITNQGGGKFSFASANDGATSDAAFTKSVKLMPYKLAIMEVSAPIEFDGLFDDAVSTANLTKLLEKAGCKKFAALIATTGVLKTYQAAMQKGLTLFAPNDDAFQAKGAPDVGKMDKTDLVTLLEYHALSTYNTKTSLKTVKGALRTLASTASGKYNMSAVAQGDDVSMDTGLHKSRVASTVLDYTPVCVLTVDSLLLPPELFAGAPLPAPAPAPASALAEAPLSSPPAPPPADAPSKAADHKEVKASSAVALRSVGAALAVAVCSVVIMS